MGKTLVLIKPDAVFRKLAFRILSRFEEVGLHISCLRFFKYVPVYKWESHYAEHKDKSFFKDLVNNMYGRPIYAVMIHGDNVVSIVRELVGATKVSEAKPGTIRHDLGEPDRPLHENLIHASDSERSASKEIDLWMS